MITHTDCVKQYQIVCLWEFKIKMLQQEVLISIGITKNRDKEKQTAVFQMLLLLNFLRESVLLHLQKRWHCLF